MWPPFTCGNYTTVLQGVIRCCDLVTQPATEDRHVCIQPDAPTARIPDDASTSADPASRQCCFSLPEYCIYICDTLAKRLRRLGISCHPSCSKGVRCTRTACTRRCLGSLSASSTFITPARYCTGWCCLLETSTTSTALQDIIVVFLPCDMV